MSPNLSLKPRKESEIQAAILRYLNLLPGVTAWRNNSRVLRLPGIGGRERLVRFGLKGGSDILGWRRGLYRGQDEAPGYVARFLAIEVKRPGLMPSPTQAAFLQSVTAAGGLAFVATCVEDVVRELGR